MPAGIGERELSAALSAGWQLQVADCRYVPVGGGGYHWVVRDSDSRRWFVTVDDLDIKRWLGDDRATVAEGLRAAMDVAVALRHRNGLRFVLAPVVGRDGLTVLRLGSQHAISVFPYLEGTSGRFGEDLSPGDRDQLIDMLATLHCSSPAPVRLARARVGLPQRDDLDVALDELDEPWRGGPFSDQARALLAASATRIRRVLAMLDMLAVHVRTLEPVITHGEPHPANLISAHNGTMLIDWDTVGAAPPERDLWWITSDSRSEAAHRYMQATGRPVDGDALAFYRLWWALDDVSIYAASLRAVHRRTPDTERAWQALKITVDGLQN